MGGSSGIQSSQKNTVASDDSNALQANQDHSIGGAIYNAAKYLTGGYQEP